MFEQAKYILLIIMAVLFWQNNTAIAQISLQNPGLNYQLGFGQNLNSYQWQTTLNYIHSFSANAVLTVAENFNSALIRVNQFDNKWRDDQKLRIGLQYPLSHNWGMQFVSQSALLKDRISGLVSDIRTDFAAAGITFSDERKFNFSSLAGYKFDRRLSKSDDGISYQVKFSADSLNWGGYESRANLFVNEDRLNDRKNNDFDVSYQVKKIFQHGTYDSLAIFYTHQRRDNYEQFTPVGLFLESLIEYTRGIRNLLNYAINKTTSLSIHSYLKLRDSEISKRFKQDILDRRSKDEVHSENTISLKIRHRKLNTDLSLSYGTDLQKNEIPDSVISSKFSKYFYYISPDYHSSKLVLSMKNLIKLTDSDTVVIRAEANKFQYDTPESNMDDRDELRLNFMVEYLHNFSDELRMGIDASANLYHLVYIFSERSANNNWMRIFRIYPKIVYQPSAKFKIIQTSEVLANYVNYDFEAPTSLFDARSYVFRRFMLQHQLNWEFWRELAVSLDYKLEIEENGKFSWDDWSELLLTKRNNHWVKANFTYMPVPYFSISSGMIYYRRDVERGNSFLLGGYLASGRKGFVSYGPVLTINYTPTAKFLFSLQALTRAVKNYGGKKQFINFVNLKLNWVY